MPEDVTPPDAGAGEAPPAPVPNAGGDGPDGTQTVPDVGGAEAWLGRLKAAGVADSDLDQGRRYHGGWDEVRGFKTRVSEMESDDYKDRVVADRFMADVDPDVQDDHREWRERWGDKAYAEARKKQHREVAAERPEESDNEVLIRRLDRLEKADKARADKAQQDQRQTAFDSDLSEIVTGMKLKKEVADFLTGYVNKSAGEDIVNAEQLADFTQKQLANINAIISSGSKATPPAPVVAEAPPLPSEAKTDGLREDGTPKTTDEMVDEVFDSVESSTEVGAGAS